MELHLSKNNRNFTHSNSGIKNFINELSDYLTTNQNKIANLSEKNQIEKEINNGFDDYFKENHLYLVTEDRDGIVFLWDFTEKSKESIEVDNLSQELLNVATEGAMLQFKNGELHFYSENGYDIVYGEDDN